MPVPPGRYLALTPRQRYLADLAGLARQIPTASVQRLFHVKAIAAARQAAAPRPSWLALFTKALAFVAAAHPELRQLYRNGFRPRLYEHAVTVAAVALARPLDETMPLLWARLRAPELLGLLEIDGLLKGFKEEAGDQVGQVRRLRARSRWPQWIRHWAWWADAALTGGRRARRLGTLAVASVGQHGADLVDPLYPATAVLSFGPLGTGGAVDVRLKFDARVLTPGRAAAILQDVERVLHCEIVMELRYYQKLEAA
jgi:hypothetical protein